MSADKLYAKTAGKLPVATDQVRDAVLAVTNVFDVRTAKTAAKALKKIERLQAKLEKLVALVSDARAHATALATPAE